MIPQEFLFQNTPYTSILSTLSPLRSRRDIENQDVMFIFIWYMLTFSRNLQSNIILTTFFLYIPTFQQSDSSIVFRIFTKKAFWSSDLLVNQIGLSFFIVSNHMTQTKQQLPALHSFIVNPKRNKVEKGINQNFNQLQLLHFVYPRRIKEK